MEKNNFSKPLDESIGSSIRHFVNMQVDRAAMKGEEKMSWVSNKVIVTTIFIIAGGIILLFLGFALSYFLGETLGNTALGFLLVALAVLLIAIIVFIFRKKLFANQMAKMYTKMLLGDEKVSDMKELHLRQQLLDEQIKDREEAFTQEYRMFKQMINPLHYVNQFVSKVKDAFRGNADNRAEEKKDGPNGSADTGIRPEDSSTDDMDNGGNYQANQF